MKKALILFLYLLLLPSFLFSETTLEEKRRIEEKKREELKQTEVSLPVKKEAAPSLPSPLDIAYLLELTPRRVTFGYDACKVLVILMGGAEQYLDLTSQAAFLKEKKLLPKKYEREFNPMQPLRKGLAAYMFCQALKIKGGVSLRLFGLSQRYALKELAFEGIMPAGNVLDIVSGEELVSAFIQAGHYPLRRQGRGTLDLKQ